MHGTLLSLQLLTSVSAAANVTRVLFVGNSFTFVNDLPHQLINIAQSLGDSVEVANSTIGGCTLYHQTPQHDARTAMLLQQQWDFIVLQDYSAMATVNEARAKYMRPAVAAFVGAKKHATEVVLYLTWGYHDGNQHHDCPSSDTAACFPLGTLASMTRPPCATNQHYHNMTRSFECMGYSVARGYFSTRAMVSGVSRVAPCGLAWQIVRGSTQIPPVCKALTDALYPTPLALKLPLIDANGTLADFMLYRVFSGIIDKHPNVAGQYLNALVMYTTLLRKSPRGAANPLPTGSAAAGDRPLTKHEKAALQIAAESAVKGCGKECGWDMGAGDSF